MNINLSKSSEHLRAILVSVDYADLLAVCLDQNLHHFKEMLIVSSPDDYDTHRVALEFGVPTYLTDSFYSQGASFNKWKALEEGLDYYGRYGWLCIMDADIVWPQSLPSFLLYQNYLYAPRRRMLLNPSLQALPQEREWDKLSLHPNAAEWAGYSQIFYAFDEHLPPQTPWHETDWKHAGGADSFFQRLWPKSHKIRPPFQVLHLGQGGKNWCGRVTPFLDGSKHPSSSSREEQLKRLKYLRRKNRNFNHERIKEGKS